MLKRERDLDATLIPGRGGEFEVTVDGTLVFSKKQEGRFPSAEEILANFSL